MNKQKAEKWEEYLAQAVRFAELSRLATEERKKHTPGSDQYLNYQTFEAVAVAVCHGFAIEMLLKGIREKRGLSFLKEHNLRRLLNTKDFLDVKNAVVEEFENNYSGFGRDKGFPFLLKEASTLFEDYRYHFEGRKLPEVNADFTSFLYNCLYEKLRA